MTPPEPGGYARVLRSWLPWACLLAFVVVMVGPTLTGARVFAATDVLESTAPWEASSTLDEVVNLCPSDTVDSTLPSILEFRDRLRAGDLALWNDEVLAGAPLAGTPLQGVVSPLVVPVLLLPEVLVPGWSKVLELAAVALGSLLLGRRLGLSTGAAAVVALAFVTSGFAVMWTGWPQARTLAFFPLVLWAVERVLQDRTWRSVVPLPLVLAGVVLGGFPALVVYLAYLVVAWVLLRWVSVRARHGWGAVGRTALQLAVGGTVAVALLLPQLVGMARFLLASDLGARGPGRAADLSPTTASTVLFPQALGTCGTEVPFWGRVTPVESNAYVGVAVAFLVLAALVLPRADRVPRGVTTLLAATAVVTFGAALAGPPFSTLLEVLPGVGSSPLGRTRSVGGLALAVLAGIGLHRLLSVEHPPSRRHGVVLGVGTLALLGVGAVTLRYAQRAADAATEAGWDLVRPTFVPGAVSAALAVLVVLTLLLRRRRLRVVLVCLLPVSALVEGLVFAGAFWARPPADTFYRTTSVHALLERVAAGERTAAVGRAMYHGAETAYEIRSLTGHSFAPRAWNQLIEEIDPLARLSPSSTRLSGSSVLGSPGLDRLSVAYLVTEPGVVPPGRDVSVTVPDAASTVPLGPGRPATTATPTADLAAVLVDVTAPVAERVVLTADLLGADGRTVASTSVELPAEGQGRRVLPFAVTGAEPAADVAEVRVTASGPVEVRGTVDGQAWLGLVARAPTLELVHTDGALVYRNVDALPRYRWASDAVVVEDPRRRVARVAAAVVPDDTVVLAEPGVPFSGEPAEVAVLQDDGDARRVRVDAEGDGMLVVADGLADGWSARLDGVEVPLVAADHALMGVAVPAGQHEVELVYRPPYPAAVLGVSALAGLLVLASLVGVLAAGARRRSSRRRAGVPQGVRAGPTRDRGAGGPAPMRRP